MKRLLHFNTVNKISDGYFEYCVSTSELETALAKIASKTGHISFISSKSKQAEFKAFVRCEHITSWQIEVRYE